MRARLLRKGLSNVRHRLGVLLNLQKARGPVARARRNWFQQRRQRIQRIGQLLARHDMRALRVRNFFQRFTQKLKRICNSDERARHCERFLDDFAAAVPQNEQICGKIAAVRPRASSFSAARRLLHSADSVQALDQDADDGPGTDRVDPAIAELRLPQVSSSVAAGEKRLTVQLISANSELVRELVRDGRTNLGIASLDPYALLNDGLEERVVWRDDSVVVVPRAIPGRRSRRSLQTSSPRLLWCSAIPRPTGPHRQFDARTVRARARPGDARDR